MELLTEESDQAEILLHEERHDLGGVSIEELHRLVYAQVLCSHAFTWQVLFLLYLFIYLFFPLFVMGLSKRFGEGYCE